MIARFHNLLLVALVLAMSSAATAQVRIVQTNSAGDNIHLIDPVNEHDRRRDQGRSDQPRRGRGSRWPPLLLQQRSRADAARRRRQDAADDEEDSADRPSEQHLDRQGRQPRLRRHRLGAGRRGRDRHEDARAREEHSDQGRHSQRLRHARREARRRRIDCRPADDGHRSEDRRAGVDAVRARACGRWRSR